MHGLGQKNVGELQFESKTRTVPRRERPLRTPLSCVWWEMIPWHLVLLTMTIIFDPWNSHCRRPDRTIICTGSDRSGV